MSLVFSDVTKRFGALVAVDGVSLTCEPGRITSIIGPNGAGKSTLINMAAGSYSVTAGRIRLGEIDITGLAKHLIFQAGLARTYQNIRLFDGLTVLQNLEVALFKDHAGHAWREVLLGGFGARVKAERRAIAMATLARLSLADLADEPASSLPYGKQKLLEIARALVAEPKAMMLDEPAAGLNHAETAELERRLREIVHPALVIVIVEHDMNLVMSLSDHIHVLHEGRLLASGKPTEIQGDHAVQEAYLGNPGEIDTIREAARGRANRVRLRADASVTRHRSLGAGG